MSVTLGEHSYIAGEIQVPSRIDVIVGKYTSIAEKLEIIYSDHPMKSVSTFPFYEIHRFDYEPCTGFGQVVIGNDVWIGMGVAIKQGVTIGDGAVIGAKSVITQDVLPYAVMCGNPAILKRYRFNDYHRACLREIKWWDWSFELIKERITEFRDVESFVGRYRSHDTQ